jgi:hypothetical protein
VGEGVGEDVAGERGVGVDEAGGRGVGDKGIGVGIVVGSERAREEVTGMEVEVI